MRLKPGKAGRDNNAMTAEKQEIMCFYIEIYAAKLQNKAGKANGKGFFLEEIKDMDKQ